MIYPNSNLPTVSQPWGRSVQKGLETLEATIISNEVNNKARDMQLQNSYVQVNKSVQDIKFAVSQAGIAIGGVNEIKTNIYVPGTTKINGTTIQTGTLSADTINGGTINSTVEIIGVTITGGTLRTAAVGNRRVEISGTSTKYHDDDGVYTGEINASGSAGSSVITILNTKSSTNYTFANFGNDSASIGLRSGNVITSRILFTNGVINLSATAGVELPFVTTTGLSNTSGQVSNSGTTNLIGAVYSQGIYDATTSQVYNVHIQGSGNSYRIYRSTAASSRTYKRDIRELQFDSEAYMSIKPVVFKYNEGILREEEKDWDIIGFIAEDFQDAGFGEQLVVQPDDEGETVQLRYDKMYMFLHKVVAEQREIIKSLSDRIEVLESN
jgi:hypothetical protein